MIQKKTETTDINKKIQELKDFDRNKVVTSTAITNARTKMSANELKVFYQIATLIKMDDKDFKGYQMEIKTFAEKLGFSETNIEYTKEVCRNLRLKGAFEIENDNEWKLYNIFSSFGINKKTNMISFSFADDMKSYLLELKRNFTTIQNVEYIKQFDSKYSIRIYALLKDYRKMAQRDFEIAELAQMFKLPKSYENYTDLYRFVLSPAIKEINEKSDLWLSEPEIIGKIHKKITHIRFHFGNKADRMANDIKNAILKHYNQTKELSAFNGFFWADEYTAKNHYKITRTQYPNDITKEYTLIGINNQEYAICRAKKKSDYVKLVVDGIYRAVMYKYENDKKEQLPFELWQKEKDERAARIQFAKELLQSWKN